LGQIVTHKRIALAALSVVLVATALVLAACNGSQDEDIDLPRRPRVTADTEPQEEPGTPRRIVVAAERDLGGILERQAFLPLPSELQQATPAVTVRPMDLPSGPPLDFEPTGPMAPPDSAPPGTGEGEDESDGDGDSSLGETSACALAVMGIVRDEDGFRILVKHNPTSETEWAVAGEIVFGYKVQLVTLKGALVEKDGRYFVLPIGENIAADTDESDTPGTGDGESPESGDGEGGDKDEPSGSAGPSEKMLAGSWKGTLGGGDMEMALAFRADHTATANVMGQEFEFKWSIDGNMLSTYGGMGPDRTQAFRFEDGGSTLVFAEDGTRFTKQ
jgi:hypothetical protein